MYKLLSVITKPKHLSTEAFVHYWQHEHAKLAKQLPKLRKYVQNHVVEKKRDGNHVQADGFVELWFDSKNDMETAFASKVGQQLLSDERHFIQDIDAFVVEEKIISE